MKKFLTLFSLLIMFATINASAKLGTPFKAKDGIATAQDLANAAGGEFTNMELFIIGTASQTFSGITVSFEMETGKSTAWIYIFRSKDNPENVKSYGVLQVPILGFQGMEIPYSQIAALIPIDPKQSLAGVSYMDSDAMLNAMKANTSFQQAATEDPTIKLEYCAIAVNPLPIYVVGDPYWAAVFSSKYKRVQCVLNSKTGTLDCTSETVSANEETDAQPNVYPNPTNNVVFVTIPKSIQAADYSFGIFDQSGNKITDLKAPTFGETEVVSFVVESLPSGVYFFNFKSANGEFSKKFVVAK